MPTTHDEVRVVIVDDHTLLREAVSDVLQTEPDIRVVGEAADADSAVAVVEQAQPDIVLLDIQMPRNQPTNTVRRLAAIAPHSKVIILSMYDDPQLVQELLDLGVHAYLHKSVSRQELSSAIRSVHRDSQRVIVSVSSRPNMTASSDGNSRSEVLSAREQEVLALVAKALSNRQIATQLSITEGTVKRHLRNIFEKLGAVSRIDAVNKALAQRR